MRIVALVSRDWSKQIVQNLIKTPRLSIKIPLVISKNINVKLRSTKSIRIKKKISKSVLNKIKDIKPNMILAYGWSDYLSEEIRSIAPCLILHPSKLPLFRGGSPIQNQILSGVTKSAVSILYAEKNLDSGDILFQKEINFKGYLDEILKRIVTQGTLGTIKIVKQIKKKKLKSFAQNEKKATFYKRRLPHESEIKSLDFSKKEAKYFYNLVRGLQEPYPECYIKCKDNTKLFLKKVYIENK